MADYYCNVVITNMDEWEEHLKKVIESKGSKSNEELFKEAITFDFKYDTIPISKDEFDKLINE